MEVDKKLNSIDFSELSPGQEETYFSEYQILGDDAWFDYTITYKRAALKVVIGLRAEDGTEYTEEITGGRYYKGLEADYEIDLAFMEKLFEE